MLNDRSTARLVEQNCLAHRLFTKTAPTALDTVRQERQRQEDSVTGNNTLTWRITDGGTPDPDRLPKVDWSTSLSGAANMLRAAIAVCDARCRELTSRGESRWPASSAAPGIVVVVEEVAAVAGDPGVRAMLEYLAHRGRTARVFLRLDAEATTLEAFGYSSVLRDYAAGTVPGR